MPSALSTALVKAPRTAERAVWSTGRTSLPSVQRLFFFRKIWARSCRLMEVGGVGGGGGPREGGGAGLRSGGQHQPGQEYGDDALHRSDLPCGGRREPRAGIVA